MIGVSRWHSRGKSASLITMTDYPPQTSEASGEPREVLACSGEFNAILETVQALGGPAAAVVTVVQVAVAKIQADAQVEVARIENGYRPEGGVHRADD